MGSVVEASSKSRVFLLMNNRMVLGAFSIPVVLDFCMFPVSFIVKERTHGLWDNFDGMKLDDSAEWNDDDELFVAIAFQVII